jgi:CHAT domain-containing protein
VDGPFRKVLGFAYSSEGEANVVSQRPSLKGASTELKTIESLFSSTQLYYGKQASRNSFLSEMEDSYDVIHLGLHAISSSNDRLENKIFFRSGTSIDDVVYGYEIIPKKINANLVVITACESAFGANVQGEGTYSLLRAFSQSGVEHVIGSLWSLPDQSSSRIIGEFYSGLISGKSPGTALNDAKRKYLESADQFTAAPYFWAGLVSYGH